MGSTDWIRELVESERRMEETGMIDLSPSQDDTQRLAIKTQEYLRDIKDIFVEFSSVFNNMKNAPVGAVKIYGISNTPSDFMLFRNGYKLIFSALAPGRIAIGMHFQSPKLTPTNSGASSTPGNDGVIEAVYGAFGEVFWTYNGSKVNPEALVRYYLSRFVRESAK